MEIPPYRRNDDCAHLSGSTVCDGGECVECTGTGYLSCGQNDNQEQQVCDSLTRTCTDQVEHGAGLCQACVSDAQCNPGEMCVLQTFDSEDVGYFCFWKQGDTENGAPASCGNARPYVETLADSSSIDAQVATICGLRTSTCIARNDYGPDRPHSDDGTQGGMSRQKRQGRCETGEAE